MVAFSRTCRFCVRSSAFAISDPPEPLLTAMLSASAVDLIPLCGRLINLGLQLTRSVPIFCPPRLVVLHIELNQAILNLGERTPSDVNMPILRAWVFKIPTPTRLKPFRLGIS
jgi:hypothetical protein